MASTERSRSLKEPKELRLSVVLEGVSGAFLSGPGGDSRAVLSDGLLVGSTGPLLVELVGFETLSLRVKPS